jgi:hypothetical protein
MPHNIEDARFGNVRVINLDLVGLRPGDCGRRSQKEGGNQNGASSGNAPRK